MSSSLAKLFGIGADVRHVVDWHLSMRLGGFAFFIVLVGLLLCWLSAWLYRREIPQRKRWLFVALRSLLFMGLVGLLLEPRVRFTIEATIRRSLLVLVDGSASMSIADPRTDEADVQRAGIAAGIIETLRQSVPPSRHEELSRIPRLDLVKDVLQNSKIDLVRRLSAGQDLRPFTFADRVTDLPNDPAKWTRSDGRSTALGDSLHDVLARTRGQPLSGVLLITDGANNAGASPSAAAAMAGRAGVPLFVWGVGLPMPRDIIVSNVYAQDVAFVDDQVDVTVRVRSAGLVGQSAEVILKQNETEVARQPLRFDADGEQVVKMQFTPKAAGDFKLTAIVPSRADEAARDNNQRSTSIRVIDGKIKVLLIDQRPRWEFKYLQAMLLRDRRVELKCLLQDADPAMSSAANSIYLPTLPTDRKDLFRFDVVIIGEMNAQDLVHTQLDSIKQYVGEFGGGVVFIAGAEQNPQGYRGTPLADLLPVELADASATSSADRSHAIHPELTTAGRAAHMLRLADTEVESSTIWAGLPPIFFDAQVGRPKPAAEVLAIDPDPSKATRFGKMPLIAIQQYGIGQVLYVGTDNVWRWRKNVGDKYYTMFWGQIVQRLALPHLLGESKKTRISLDKKQYAVGERVTVYARLYGDGFDPVTDVNVTAGYQAVGGTAGRQAVQLRALRDPPGMYSGEFVTTTAGAFEFSTDRDRATREPFEVVEPKLEMGDTAMNEPLLRQMAQASGGAFYREDDLAHLPDDVQRKSETVRSTIDVPLWSSPIYFLMLIALITAEWILRKVWDLK